MLRDNAYQVTVKGELLCIQELADLKVILLQNTTFESKNIPGQNILSSTLQDKYINGEFLFIKNS